MPCGRIFTYLVDIGDCDEDDDVDAESALLMLMMRIKDFVV